MSSLLHQIARAIELEYERRILRASRIEGYTDASHAEEQPEEPAGQIMNVPRVAQVAPAAITTAAAEPMIELPPPPTAPAPVASDSAEEAEAEIVNVPRGAPPS